MQLLLALLLALPAAAQEDDAYDGEPEIEEAAPQQDAPAETSPAEDAAPAPSDDAEPPASESEGDEEDAAPATEPDVPVQTADGSADEDAPREKMEISISPAEDEVAVDPSFSADDPVTGDAFVLETAAADDPLFRDLSESEAQRIMAEDDALHTLSRQQGRNKRGRDAERAEVEEAAYGD